MSIDEILDGLRHLTPSQVHSALAYYFDHLDEINADLEEASNIEYLKTAGTESSIPASPG